MNSDLPQNSYSTLKHLEIWIEVERAMAKLEEKDNSLSGHVIEIRLLPGNNFSFISNDPHHEKRR